MPSISPPSELADRVGPPGTGRAAGNGGPGRSGRGYTSTCAAGRHTDQARNRPVGKQVCAPSAGTAWRPRRGGTKLTRAVNCPPAGTSIQASECQSADSTFMPMPKRSLPGLDKTASRMAGSSANTGAGARKCSVKPRKVAWVRCIDTTPQPASKNVNT